MAEETVTEEVTPVEEEAVTEAPTEEPAEVAVETPVEEPVVMTTKKRNQKIAEETARIEAEYQEAVAALPEPPRPVSQMVVARSNKRP